MNHRGNCFIEGEATLSGYEGKEEKVWHQVVWEGTTREKR